MFDDIFEFVLLKWPEKIDTSIRNRVNFEKMQGTLQGLSKIEESNKEFFEPLNIGNLLIHLNYSLFIAIHKIGLLQNVIRPKELNKAYIQFLFEKKSIAYAVEPKTDNIPIGIRDNLEDIYDKQLIQKYFQINKGNGDRFI